MTKYKVKINLSDGTSIASNDLEIPTKISELQQDVYHYRHNITIVLSGGIYCTFSIINSSSLILTTSSALITALYNAGFTDGTHLAPAQGQYAATGYTNWIIGVYASSPSQNPYLNFRYITLAATSGTTMTVNTTPSSSTSSYSLTSASITDQMERF